MKVSFGQMTGQSERHIDATVQQHSTLNIDSADQSDNSILTFKVLELPPSTDMARFSKDLGRIAREVRSKAASPESLSQASVIDAAKSAAERGDLTETAKYLQKAGAWVLDVAKQIGVPVAVEALKGFFK
jgi:hypothetical protein